MNSLDHVCASLGLTLNKKIQKSKKLKRKKKVKKKNIIGNENEKIKNVN